MAIEASLVMAAFKLLLGRTMGEAEAQDLAITLGNREELLAFLLTRTGFLAEHPDAREELLRVAAQHGLDAQTRRAAFGPTAEMHSLSETLRTEITRVVTEAAQPGAASAVDDLVHRLNQLGFARGVHPALAPEGWIKP